MKQFKVTKLSGTNLQKVSISHKQNHPIHSCIIWNRLENKLDVDGVKVIRRIEYMNLNK